MPAAYRRHPIALSSPDETSYVMPTDDISSSTPSTSKPIPTIHHKPIMPPHRKSARVTSPKPTPDSEILAPYLTSFSATIKRDRKDVAAYLNTQITTA
ncbi:hypothetical protein EJ06DRAFT_530186 [Trichodelitschia bisporula]|uniref:Uncharacterized protein n=1 Tax=Trichodelitschia bisporula TaxID=703511 RepID=A0A6G1HWK4_9PEZI|nr:hypothetical protein EJ06DRAFT_530186 [Trichodelitschia bisporula]